MKIGIVGIILSGLVGVAAAGEWADYRKAFPLFPCSDGWSMCEIDGQTIGPGLTSDSQGNPIPANMRFSFWTLESMPTSSPFNGLSSYSGSMGDGRDLKEPPAVAAAQTPKPVRSAEPPPQREVMEEPREEYVPDEVPAVAVAVPPPAPVPVPPPEPVPVPQPVYEPEPVEAPTPSVGYQPPSLAEIEQARAATEPVAPEPVAPEPVAPEPVEPPPVEAPPVVEAPPPMPPPIEEDSEPVAVAEPPPPPPVAAPPPPVATTVTCDDLVALESAAIMGQLGVDRRKCLETSLVAGSKITGKDKISRVLIADAKARGDEADWERLMKRHLERLDRSDPNMCLVFAISLHKKGVGKSTQVIRWADYAMENKAVWSGSTHTRNVYYLHKLKSQAASRLWKRAEKKFVTDRNEKNEAKANQYRSMAKQFSRAWLDYAKASGKDTSQPLAACVSASGNTEFCPT